MHNGKDDESRYLIHRFSQFATNGALQVKTSWEAKQEKRRKLQRTKELEKNLTEARIEERRARREQNELKSMKVQTVYISLSPHSLDS